MTPQRPLSSISLFDSFEPILDFELLENAVHMVLHRVERKAEMISDLLIAEAIGYQCQNLDFTRSQTEIGDLAMPPPFTGQVCQT